MSKEKEKILLDWIKYKSAETKAKAKRYECEEKIQKLYPLTSLQKSKTFNDKDLGFKTNISKNIVNKMDQEKYSNVRKNLPLDLRPEKIVFELDVKGFEYLKEHEPELYKQVSDCVTTKENKSTIEVEKLKR